jgi:hypothetical protein
MMGNPNSGRQVFKRVDIDVTDPLLLLLKIYSACRKVKDRTRGAGWNNRRGRPVLPVVLVVREAKKAVFLEILGSLELARCAPYRRKERPNSVRSFIFAIRSPVAVSAANRGWSLSKAVLGENRRRELDFYVV